MKLLLDEYDHLLVLLRLAEYAKVVNEVNEADTILGPPRTCHDPDQCLPDHKCALQPHRRRPLREIMAAELKAEVLVHRWVQESRDVIFVKSGSLAVRCYVDELGQPVPLQLLRPDLLAPEA